ncbi:MAG: cysteine desulfurase NifS [Deltaproteobacteria bacterium]|nr:cysteine desulfurase NifS [Deltaproteobacteria bacterium]
MLKRLNVKQLIYVDNNATTKVDTEVLDAMLPYFSDYYGNPSSMHSFGGETGYKIAEARARVAALINASPDEIIFTSCGTESDNTAINAALRTHPGKKHIITTRVEHPAIKSLCEDLSRNGHRITYVPVDNEGLLDIDYLYDHITDDTAIVSVMWANNETGVIFPIEEIAGELSERGIVFHTDAVQAAGKIPIDVQKVQVDMLSMSGHKIHAPKGIGVIYIRKGTRFSPFLIGGHQETGRRGGTENVATIIGMGKACELAMENLENEQTKIKRLRDMLEAEILKTVPSSMVNGNRENRLPTTTNISFEFVEGEAILLMLNEYGICASSGSACTTGSLEPSHVLRAMGVPYTAAHGSIRFSLSKYNTEKEIKHIIEKVPPIIKRLRELSPFWNVDNGSPK